MDRETFRLRLQELRQLARHRGQGIRLQADRNGASAGMIFAKTSAGVFFLGGTQRPEDATMIVEAFNLAMDTLEKR